MDNFTDCLNACSDFPFTNGPCVAAVYGFATDKECWMTNSTLNSTSQLKPDNNTHTALVHDLSIFQNLDMTCPFDNDTTHATPNGLNFDVYCDSDSSGNDLTPGSTINGSAITAHYHANSLVECMDYCSTMRPKCFGVTWNPLMIGGYWNCYPKISKAMGNIVYSNISHFALAQFDTAFNTTCSPGTVTTSSKDTFNMTCDVGASGDIISSVYETNFEDCIDACASYTPEDTSGRHCVAASYEPDGADGYENCYLMASAHTNGTRPNWRLAQLLDSSGQTVPASNGANSTGGGGGSKAWIAGPVIGALAAIALAVGGFLWYRKRHSSSKGENSWQQQRQPIMGELGDSRWRDDRGELDANFTERKELEARHARAKAMELPG